MKSIFVSSTFRDMQAERDLIQEEVLPRLKSEARKYGENINVIDLRWGVDTSELESEEGSMKVMSVCLDEVERSHPYMLIFLGERYGSVIDPAITEKVIARKNSDFKLDDYAISITAMEVEFGALADKYGSLENCIVCMRSFEPEMIGDATEREIYSAENEELAKKQKAFKDKVVNKLHGRVIEYSCSWNDETKQLVEFKTLDGELLADKLVSTYEEMFGEEWDEFGKLSWEEKEQLAAGAIIETKLKSFSGRQKLIDYYYNKVLSEENTLVLKGEVGSGKTSIMCKLMQKLEENGEKVFRFIAGNSSMSENAMQLVQQMVYFMENVLGTEHYEEAIKYSDWMDRLEELAVRLKGGKRVYFVIDAVDQMYQDEHMKRLDFILPDCSMKYVISCTDEFEIPRTYGMSKLMVEQIPALSVEDARNVVDGMLTASSRNVYKAILNEILSKKASTNPLYISMLIQRLNMMGFDELYSAWAESDIVNHGCEVIRRMPDGAEFAAIFIIEEAIRRLDMESHALRDVVNMIGVSRGGLRENDIIEISKNLGNQVNQLDIARLIHYLDTFFVVHLDGRIDFTHKVIRKGIRERVNHKKFIEAIAARIKSLDEEDELWQSEGMYYARMTEDAKFAEKIFVYAHEEKEKRVLEAIKEEGLADAGAFYCEKMGEIPRAIRFFCFSWINLFDLVNEQIILQEKVCRRFTEIAGEIYKKSETLQSLMDLSVSYENMGNALEAQGKASEAFAYFQKGLEAKEEVHEKSGTLQSLMDLSVSYNNMGMALNAQGKAVEALGYYQKGLEAIEEVHEKCGTLQSLRELSVSYNNMGRALETQGRAVEAFGYYQKALEASEEVHEKSGTLQSLRELSLSYHNMGRALEEQGNAGEAFGYYQKGLEASEEVHEKSGTLQSLRDLSISYNNVGRALEAQGQAEKALEYYQKCMEASKEVHEKSGTLQSLRELSLSYDNMGRALEEQGKASEAFVCYQKGLEASKEVHEKSRTLQSLRDLSISYHNMGRALEVQGKAVEAFVYYQKALEASEEVHEKSGTLQSLRELSVIYHNIGRTLEVQGKAVALLYYQKALEASEEVREKSGTLQSLRELSVIYDNMGRALKAQGKAGEALVYYQKAVEAKEEVREKSGTLQSLKDLSVSYNNMARVLKAQGKAVEAFAYYQKAVEVGEEVHEKSGTLQSLRELSVSYNNIGRALEVQGKAVEAFVYYQKALEASEEVHEKSETLQSLRELSVSYINMGRALEAQGKAVEAFVYYQKALKAGEEVHEKSGTLQSLRELSVSYNNMGRILEELGEYVAALTYAKKTMKAFERVTEEQLTIKNYRETAYSYIRCCNILIELEQYEEAMQYASKAFSHMTSVLEENQDITSLEFYIRAVASVIRCNLMIKGYEECRQYFDSIFPYIDMYEEKITTEKAPIMRVMMMELYADYLNAIGKADEAKKQYKEAFAIIEKVGDKVDDAECRKLLRTIGEKAK